MLRSIYYFTFIKSAPSIKLKGKEPFITQP